MLIRVGWIRRVDRCKWVVSSFENKGDEWIWEQCTNVCGVQCFSGRDVWDVLIMTLGIEFDSLIAAVAVVIVITSCLLRDNWALTK